MQMKIALQELQPFVHSSKLWGEVMYSDVGHSSGP